jgi:hypothetical protein
VDWVDSPFHHKRGGMDVVCKFNCCSTFKGEENLCHSIQTIICKARAIQFTYNNILGFTCLQMSFYGLKTVQR